MDTKELLEKQSGLTERLKWAAQAYYSEDSEVMSNLEYDRLYDELLALESETGIVFAGSPTQRVGYEVSAELEKLEHAAPMLSLHKTKDTEELITWLGEHEGLLSYKLDGLTVVLTYEGGELASAVTRGDGVVGEVVTAGARTFLNIPLKIPYEGRLVLRGEAVIKYSDFNAINKEIEDTASRYKNPRNLVSGSVRQLDSSVTARRRVRFFAFGMIGSVDEAALGVPPKPVRSKQQSFLTRLGFDTVPYEIVTARVLAETVARFSETAAAPGFDLPVDGLVLEYDNIAYAESLGATSKFPHGAIAFKWADEEAETELLEIEWSASRTGLINPIAVFRPVELEGTTVSRASVHNVSILEELALGKGDTIRVYKANMIIPQISDNLTRSGTERPPAACPVCDAATELKDADGIKTLFCPNEECPAKKLKSFTHFVSRPCMNIEGLSEQTLEKFIAAGLLHELADVFKLAAHKAAITGMEGFGEKSYDNLIAAIEIAREAKADRLLAALGIPEVGAATAKAIARAFENDWNRITSAAPEELAEIPGVGAIIAALYTAWFANPKNKATASAAFSELNATTTPDFSSSPETGKISGLTFVITGSLNGYKSRDLLQEKIESLGGKVSSSVSSKTNYLINNDAASPSSKNKTARSLGVKIITESEFETLADPES